MAQVPKNAPRRAVNSSIVQVLKSRNNGNLFPPTRASCCALVSSDIVECSESLADFKPHSSKHYHSNVDLSNQREHASEKQERFPDPDIECGALGSPLFDDNVRYVSCTEQERESRKLKPLELWTCNKDGKISDLVKAVVDTGASRCFIVDWRAKDQGWRADQDEPEMDLRPIETISGEEVAFLGVHKVKAVVRATGQSLYFGAHVVPRTSMRNIDMIIGETVLVGHNLLDVYYGQGSSCTTRA